MATNKEIFDWLENSVQEIQASMQRFLEQGHERQNQWGRMNGSSQQSSGNSSGNESEGNRASNASIRSQASRRRERERRRTQVNMDFLKLGGEEPRVWLSRAKQFFLANDLHGTQESDACIISSGGGRQPVVTMVRTSESGSSNLVGAI
ncbi:hypothetical protein ACP275_08G093800 [Erythranthe tilingii]